MRRNEGDGGAASDACGAAGDVRPLRSDAFIRRAMDDWGATVWRLALAQTGSREDAEDVCQDVFVRLAQNATAFSDGEHLKAWLLRVAVNRCHDVARSRKRRPSVPLHELPFEPVETGVLSRDDMRELWSAVDNLSEPHRAVVHLYYYEGYSGPEIAQLLGVETSTVRTRLQRAREQLRNALGGVDDDF